MANHSMIVFDTFKVLRLGLPQTTGYLKLPKNAPYSPTRQPNSVADDSRAGISPASPERVSASARSVEDSLFEAARTAVHPPLYVLRGAHLSALTCSPPSLQATGRCQARLARQPTGTAGVSEYASSSITRPPHRHSKLLLQNPLA